MALFPIAKPKAHSLTGRITQPLLHAAFKAVKRNRGAAGNQVIRGTAHYFATRWFTGRHVFRKLDCWIRRRVRCMKFKRFGYPDNRRWRVKQAEQLGLLRLESFCWS